MYPSECRERGITYKGAISASLVWRVNDKMKGTSFGEECLGEGEHPFVETDLPTNNPCRSSFRYHKSGARRDSHHAEIEDLQPGWVEPRETDRERRGGPRDGWIFYHQWHRKSGEVSRLRDEKVFLGLPISSIVSNQTNQ